MIGLNNSKYLTCGVVKWQQTKGRQIIDLGRKRNQLALGAHKGHAGNLLEPAGLPKGAGIGAGPP